MIQPVKKLRILSLTVKGFKGFSEETAFTFGDLNTITGHNGQGKSSIADAIAFAITGVSFYGGSRLDHLYHKNTRDISVVMEFSDESGAVRRLFRSRVNDNMDIFLDERRMTQRDLTIMFGERDLFLSMLNPRYFIDILGAKGRDLLERYLPDIPKETILASLSEHNQALLEGQDFLSAEAFAQTLREEIAQLKRDAIYTQALADTQARIDTLKKEVSRQKYIVAGLKPGVQCPMCKQTVTEATLPKVKQEFQTSVDNLSRQGKEQIEQFTQLKTLDDKAKAVFNQFQQDDIAKAERTLADLKASRDTAVENAQQKNAQRQQEIDRLHAEIQNTELDLECGLLSPAECERLRQVNSELVKLAAEIEVLSSQSTELPAGQTERLEQICSLYASVTGIEIPPFLHKSGVYDSCFRHKENLIF